MEWNYLIRKQVNNGEVTVTQYGAGGGPETKPNKEWLYLCERCHNNLRSDNVHVHPVDGPVCTACHPHGGDYRNCKDCHFHGNRTIDGSDYGEQLF